MSGAGNLFTVLDGRQDGISSLNFISLAPLLCDSQLFDDNQKSEGVLVINPSEYNHFDVDYYNPDGSDGMMCGNGGRCAVRFAYLAGMIDTGQELKFKMSGNIYMGKIIENAITIQLPPPVKLIESLELEVDGIAIPGSFVDVNSDHYIVNFVNLNSNDIESFDLKNFSKPLRHHMYFGIKGANINVYKVLPNNKLRLRTFERGVEAETGACGTGSVSTALCAYLKGEIKLPVRIIPPSKEEITVHIIGEIPENIKYFELTGPAIIINEREIDLMELA